MDASIFHMMGSSITFGSTKYWFIDKKVSIISTVETLKPNSVGLLSFYDNSSSLLVISAHWERVTSAADRLPANAICIDQDENGSPIYLGRAEHEGQELPAKIMPNKKVAYVVVNNIMLAKHEFDVLCTVRFSWTPMSFGSKALMVEINKHLADVSAHTIPVKKVCSRSESFKDTSIENHNKMELMDLNDDCLAEIGRQMPLTDLHSYALTCTRLNAAARVAFKSNPGNMQLDIADLMFVQNEYTIAFLDSYLKTFGDLIKEVILTGMKKRIQSIVCKTFDLNDVTLQLIVKYCSTTLETLQLTNVFASLPLPSHSSSLMSNLRVLRLQNFYELPENRNEFRIGVRSHSQYYFEYKCFRKNYILEAVNTFVSSNPTKLERLEITDAYVNDTFISSLAEYVNLKYLKMTRVKDRINGNFDALHNLKQLEELDLEIDFGNTGRNTAEFLINIDAIDTMRSLHLGSGDIADALTVVRKFINLRQLRVRYSDKLHGLLVDSTISELILTNLQFINQNGNLLRLVQAMPKLEVLTLVPNTFPYNPINLSTFNELVELYRDRQRTLTIKCANPIRLTSVAEGWRLANVAYIEIVRNMEFHSLDYLSDFHNPLPDIEDLFDIISTDEEVEG